MWIEVTVATCNTRKPLQALPLALPECPAMLLWLAAGPPGALLLSPTNGSSWQQQGQRLWRFPRTPPAKAAYTLARAGQLGSMCFAMRQRRL